MVLKKQEKRLNSQRDNFHEFKNPQTIMVEGFYFFLELIEKVNVAGN